MARLGSLGLHGLSARSPEPPSSLTASVVASATRGVHDLTQPGRPLCALAWSPLALLPGDKLSCSQLVSGFVSTNFPGRSLADRLKSL